VFKYITLNSISCRHTAFSSPAQQVSPFPLFSFPDKASLLYQRIVALLHLNDSPDLSLLLLLLLLLQAYFSDIISRFPSKGEHVCVRFLYCLPFKSQIAPPASSLWTVQVCVGGFSHKEWEQRGSREAETLPWMCRPLKKEKDFHCSMKFGNASQFGYSRRLFSESL